MPDANHSLPSRRDAREQEQLIAQTATVAIEMAQPFIRFQSDLLSSWANLMQVFAKIYQRQAETISQFGQDMQQYSQQANR